MPDTVTPTAIPEVLILEPKVFGESRGFCFESSFQLLGKLVRCADLADKAWADAEVFA